MENMETDWRDQEILKLLYENPKGLRHIELLKKTEFAKKTLQTHLKYLLRENLIEQIKNRKKAKNSKTIYKVVITKEQSELEKLSINYSLLPEIILKTSNVNKMGLLSAMPHLLQVIATVYNDMAISYLFKKKGKIYYQIYLKILEERFDNLRKFIDKTFSKSQIERIMNESEIISELDNRTSQERFLSVVITRPYYRTQDEIFLDNKNSIFKEMESKFDKSRIPKTRLEKLKDQKRKNKLIRLEKKYKLTRRDLYENFLELNDFNIEKDSSKRTISIKSKFEKQATNLIAVVDGYMQELEYKIGEIQDPALYDSESSVPKLSRGVN